MHYTVWRDCTIPSVSLPALRSRARRRGYTIIHDRAVNAWSLIDRRLRRPIVGFDRVTLPTIAHAVELARGN